MRENARRASCQSNLKQIGLAITQYEQDSDELHPNRNVGVGWRGLINPFIKANGVFRCPSNSVGTTNAADGFPESYSANQNRGGTGSSAGSDGVGGPFGDTNGTGVSLAQITAPATVIDVVESTAAYTDFNVTATCCFVGGGGNNGYLYSGHTSQGNFLFCDGHVKTLRPFATIDSTAGGSNAVNMWTIDNSVFVAAHGGDPTNAQTILAASANLYK